VKNIFSLDNRGWQEGLVSREPCKEGPGKGERKACGLLEAASLVWHKRGIFWPQILLFSWCVQLGRKKREKKKRREKGGQERLPPAMVLRNFLRGNFCRKLATTTIVLLARRERREGEGGGEAELRVMGILGLSQNYPRQG